MRGVRSFESNAFHLLVERINHWENRYRDVVCGDKLAAQVLEEMRSLRSGGIVKQQQQTSEDIGNLLGMYAGMIGF